MISCVDDVTLMGRRQNIKLTKNDINMYNTYMEDRKRIWSNINSSNVKSSFFY